MRLCVLLTFLILASCSPPQENKAQDSKVRGTTPKPTPSPFASQRPTPPPSLKCRDGNTRTTFEDSSERTSAVLSRLLSLNETVHFCVEVNSPFQSIRFYGHCLAGSWCGKTKIRVVTAAGLIFESRVDHDTEIVLGPSQIGLGVHAVELIETGATSIFCREYDLFVNEMR